MFLKQMNNRMRLVLFIILILFIVIILKVFYIQVINYKKLNKLAASLWSRNLPIEANRGIIYDRNGIELANNITTSSLILIPNQIKDKEMTANQLSKVLNVDYKEMYKHVSKKTSIERVHPEGRRLNNDIAEQINKLKLDGVYLVKEAKRNYPNNELLSHTLGYVGIDNQGLSGLELTLNDYLTGKNGAIKYFSDAKGSKLKLSGIYEQPQNGMNITLTINYQIQEALERELINAYKMYNPEQTWGIVMNPNNGEVLAISSIPNFSPNDYQEYDLKRINKNLPIWMTYEPGSTFKIISLSGALEDKLLDLDKDTIYDSGHVKIGGATIHCWKHGGHGLQTYLEVVENSCNLGFVNIGLKLGKDRLFDYVKKFGFGEKTGIELNGEENGIIFDINKIGELETVTTAFGQGVSVTAIHLVV